MLVAIRRLFEHLAWADDCLLAALEEGPVPPEKVLREYAHILGADELWLSRLEQRLPTVMVWPDLALPQLRALAQEVHSAYSRYLATLNTSVLLSEVSYTNSAGQFFRTPVQEILIHVAMHAHYHRGKVNLLLRQAGCAPMPADYIGFIRGVPAAITLVPQRGSSAG
jgi:uncharacterized damage-inducible protein DinB